MPVPSGKERIDLWQWVKSMPSREGLSGYDNVLKYCAEKYNNEPADLTALLRTSFSAFQEAVRATLMKTSNDHFPDPTDVSDAVEKHFAAAMLRMWVYAAEYYQRWTAGEVFAPIDPDHFDQFLRDLEPPKE